jgi:putative transposase
MERRITAGIVVEHAGKRWRVDRPLGADAVLLCNDAGEVVTAAPSTIRFPEDRVGPSPLPPIHELQYTETEWAEATRRREVLTDLARKSSRSHVDVDRAAKELGLKRRRVFELLRLAQTGCGIEPFLPARMVTRAKRLDSAVEAIITQAIRTHYAKANRPSMQSLHREVAGLCGAAGLTAPSVHTVHARVRESSQTWLLRRRHGPKTARTARLLTGAHPGAPAPWQRVQIDSTPCDIQLVSEQDRQVIGRPNVTFAIDMFSRAVLGFSVSLEAASTLTVASCLAHACLPKEEWLAARDLSRVHWPIWGRPAILEYDQGPENEARGIQRGLRRYGIEAKVRPKGHPEQHGTIERLIGTMMRMVHALRGTTWSNITERGESDHAARACLTLPELERILALAIDNYNHATHTATGQRPIEQYLGYYRRPDLPGNERIPPRLPADRFLLDFLPFELRALRRTGIALFKVDYSSVDLLPLWRRDNQKPVERVIVYDPRGLARVWLLDETTDAYIAVPYRVPHPDMTLAQSQEARRRMRASRAQDRTERRLFENLVEIRAIEEQARSATSRRKAERTRQAGKATRESTHARPDEIPRPDIITAGALEIASQTTGPAKQAGPINSGGRPALGAPGDLAVPAWAGQTITPFIDVEQL